MVVAAVEYRSDKPKMATKTIHQNYTNHLIESKKSIFFYFLKVYRKYVLEVGARIT